MSIESVILPNHLILCHPFLLLPSIFSSIRVFLNVSALCIRWPKYCSFNIIPSNEYSGLISFRISWFGLVVKRTLQGLLQHHSINSSTLSLLYGLTLTPVHDYWKNDSFDYMDLCWESNVSAFYMLCRFVIAFFFPRSKCLLTSWLQSSSAVILEPKKIKPVTVSIVSSIISHEIMGPEPMTLLFEC